MEGLTCEGKKCADVDGERDAVARQLGAEGQVGQAGMEMFFEGLRVTRCWRWVLQVKWRKQ